MYNILYIDDEPDLLELGKLFLEDTGIFTVDTQTSAVESVKLLSSVRYDAIVSDYQMPEMDGIAFLKTLRSREDTTPFIIFTGKGREEVVIEALNNGADFYIQKGWDIDSQFVELTHKIERAIERRNSILALERSEAGYRHLIESASEVIYVTQDERIVLINPKITEISGYSVEDLLYKSFNNYVHPDDRAVVLDRYRRRIAGEDLPCRYPFRIIHKNGTLRWVELNVVTIEWDDRPATLNFLTDITERKIAIDALRESEERYRNFFKTTQDAVFITTPDGYWIDFNDALMKIFGYTRREEIEAVSVSSVYLHPDERVAFLDYVVKNGYVRDHPMRFRKQDGTIFDAIITIVPQISPDGVIRKFIGTFHDITDRKRAEDTLRESEERYHMFFKTTLDSVFITAPDGQFIDFNDALMEHMGATRREDVLAMNVIDSYTNPEDRIVFLAKVKADGYLREYPMKLKRLDGTVFDSRITIIPQKNPDGSIKSYIGTVREQ